MPNIYLKVPNTQELHYRQEWMKDPKTMSYNAGYDMELKGYDKTTGTITKTDEEMITWYNNWVNKEPDKYFAYIYDSEIAEPIGEVYYYLDNGIHSMGIVIQDKYRGKGYSYNALLELEKIAFEKNNISELSDIIPENRIGAIKSFKKAGFIHTELEKKDLVFGKESIAKQLLITKENYLYKLNNKSVKYSWVRNELPHNYDVKQVYGIVFSDDCRILLRIDNNKYKLSGGKPEINESFEETLKREYLEELNIEIKDVSYLGYLLVEENNKKYAQVRMISKISQINKNRPDIYNGKLYGRFLSNVDNVKKYLNYSDLAGNMMIDEAIKKAKNIYDFNSQNMKEEKI